MSGGASQKDPAATAMNYLFFVGAMALVVILLIVSFTSRVYVRVAAERSLVTQVQCVPLEGFKTPGVFLRKLRGLVARLSRERVQEMDICKFIDWASEYPELLPNAGLKASGQSKGIKIRDGSSVSTKILRELESVRGNSPVLKEVWNSLLEGEQI